MNWTPYPLCRSRRVDLFYLSLSAQGRRFAPGSQARVAQPWRPCVCLPQLTLPLEAPHPPHAFCHLGVLPPSVPSSACSAAAGPPQPTPLAFPSIFNPLIFSELQITFFANSLFSHRSKTPGGPGSSLPARLLVDHQSQVTSFQEAAASCPSLCSVFAPRFLYFQQLTDTFLQTPGVGVAGNFRPIESATYRLFSFNFSTGASVCGPQRRISNRPSHRGFFRGESFY